MGIRIFYVLGSLLFLGGCTGFATTMSSGDSVDQNAAYLYGRFNMVKPALSDQAMGFIVECDDKKRYTLGFSKSKSVQVLKISPATCSIPRILYIQPSGIERFEGDAPEGTMKDVKLEAGTMYYLGDFHARGSSLSKLKLLVPVPGGFLGVRDYKFRWDLKSVVNDYNTSTAELKSSFPGFSRFPTEDKMLKISPSVETQDSRHTTESLYRKN